MDALEEKKGEDILLLDLRGITILADFFVVCSGTSDRMLHSLADAVEDHARSEWHVHARQEGAPQDGWVLVDFGDVIVHLFSPDKREYYQLEELWSQAKVLLRLQ